MAYDPADGYLVLFGGCVAGDYWHSTCQPTNATWTFANGTWSPLVVTIAPPARFGASLVWDAADGYLVLFGGNGSASTGFLNDTWTFLHGTWSPVATSVAPGPRAFASSVYDAEIGAVVVYGGERDRTLVAPPDSYVGEDWTDSWAYQAGTWTNLGIRGPTARDGAAISYDPG